MTIGASQAAADTSRETMLVTADWLSSQVDDPNLVILHVGSREAYDAGHIAGARFLGMEGLSPPVEPTDPLILEMPTPEALQDTLEELGITQDSRIVVYFEPDMLPAATRVVYTLQSTNLGEQTSLLDGGLPGWLSGDRPVTTDEPAVARTTLAPLDFDADIVDADFVREHAAAPGYALIDARATIFYDGVQAGMATSGVRGHAAGAVNVPFSSVTDLDHTLKSSDELAALFAEAGVESGDQVVVYCHVGWQATAVIFAARSLGIDAVLYDGSFQDWAARELPVEVSAPADAP